MQNYAYAKQIPATTITGSIIGYWANAATTISDSVWGEFNQQHFDNSGTIATNPGNQVITTTNISVAAGILLRGPMVALKTNAVGIVYYNGTLHSQTNA